MLTVYPSNRLEHLTTLLFAVLNKQQGNVLQPKKVIVESNGIRHWIQMRLAETQGIAMNLKFQMPSAFLWDLCRDMLDDGAVPKASPFSESVLTWRIDALLASDDFIQSDALGLGEGKGAADVTRYWLSPEGKPDKLKRFQLASKLASLFEQYIKFRPDWVDDWEKGVVADDEDTQWQAKLWQLLIEEILPSGDNIHPSALQSQALERLKNASQHLPEHIYLFGINSLPGPSLDFFKALSSYTHVHLFHLNPCVEFWGDIQSDKAKARQLRQQQSRDAQWNAWVTTGDNDESVNPLLANLGQQGKAFFNSLQTSDHFEISAFDEGESANEENELASQLHLSILHQLQQDILTLRNAGHEDHLSLDNKSLSDSSNDGSLVISSAHSSLREIQSLHDYLLHQFNQDPHLKPRDVLVMCPDIEAYAPYVDAVFRRPWQHQKDGESPRLPCSIADRVTLEEEPLIGAFLDLMTLPDSRFEVSKMLDYLRVPAIQGKFGFTASELDTIEWWLKEACIHWGLDSTHKAKQSGLDASSETFSWFWGLERLLLGFAHGDAEFLVEERLLLPHVDGQDAVLLGQLMHLLDRLRFYAQQMQMRRTPDEWLVFLKAMKNGLFTPTAEEESASHIIEEVINQLADSTRMAGYALPIEFSVIQSYLNHHFTRPDTGNNFMTGQVTFCSMVPMRSIPFKVIAVLGLNDGDFPRQDRTVSFDLLKSDTPRAGDRSRRADDRYIFLETLISAREKLYLSYQGRDVKNNEERQPSLVLKELMHYLEQGYGWDFSNGAIRQQPLQPFSPNNFTDPLPSFDAQWCRLSFPLPDRDNLTALSSFALSEESVELDTLVSFFDDPLKWFARHRLNLFLEVDEALLEDAEPFDIDALTGYQVRTAFIESLRESEGASTAVDFVANIKASGRLPESPVTETRVTAYQTQAEVFYEAIKDLGAVEKEWVSLDIDGLSITAELPWLNPLSNQSAKTLSAKTLLVTRPAKRKPKDELQMWLMHLVALVHESSKQTGAEQTEADSSGIETLGVFFNKTHYGKVSRCRLSTEDIDTKGAGGDVGTGFDARLELKKLLQLWYTEGANRPMILHAMIGADCAQMDERFFDDKVRQKLQENAYFRWFFGSGKPVNENDLETLQSVYNPLYSRLTEMRK